MQKLIAVEEAKTLFSEAKGWGLWKWLSEKRRARHTADAAWAALEAYEAKVRESWSEDIVKAWKEAEALAAANANGRSRRSYEKARQEAEGVHEEIRQASRTLKEADIEAQKARDDAEAQFDEADRRMSTSMACQGAQMALDAWNMREKVIRKAETLKRVGHV